MKAPQSEYDAIMDEMTTETNDFWMERELAKRASVYGPLESMMIKAGEFLSNIPKHSVELWYKYVRK